MTDLNIENTDTYLLDLMGKALKRIEIPIEALFIPRSCFKCHKPLVFSEYLSSNPSKEISELIRLWKEESIEIFCCGCFKRNKLKEHLKKMLEDIPSRICNRCNRDLPIEDYLDISIIESFNGLEVWKNMTKKLKCISCRAESERIKTQKSYKKFLQEGIAIGELVKLGLRMGVSILINGIEVINRNQIVREGDKIEVLIKNARIIAKLARILPDDFDSHRYRHQGVFE